VDVSFYRSLQDTVVYHVASTVQYAQVSADACCSVCHNEHSYNHAIAFLNQRFDPLAPVGLEVLSYVVSLRLGAPIGSEPPRCCNVHPALANSSRP
jgi:hypothetical protein